MRKILNENPNPKFKIVFAPTEKRLSTRKKTTTGCETKMARNIRSGNIKVNTFSDDPLYAFARLIVAGGISIAIILGMVGLCLWVVVR